MARRCRVTFLVDADEREVIKLVAAELRRTPSDALRYLVHQAAQELDVRPPAREAQPHSQVHHLTRRSSAG